MNNYVKITMLALFALTAAACSQKDEPAAAMDDAVEEATVVLEEASVGAMEKAGDLGDEAMSAADATMDDAKGKVGDIVDETKDLANEAMDKVVKDAEGMTEEELEARIAELSDK